MTSPGRLEYAARYTHTFRDGRTIQVTNTHHENPGDRAWAVERLEEMVRAQQALGRTVDAHLVTRHAATEWVPERPGPLDAEETALTESIGRVAAYLSDGPPRVDRIVDGKVRHAQATDHISRRSAGFAGGTEVFHDLLYSDLVVVLAAARVEANALTASPEPADASPAISGEAEAERLKPAYPEPGSEIPGQPGYVVGTCGHRLAGSEWRAGFRTCENCTDAQDDDA